jgi:hypothetical protein
VCRTGLRLQQIYTKADSRANANSKEGIATHWSSDGWPVSAVPGYLLFKDFCETLAEEPVPQLKFYEEVSTVKKKTISVTGLGGQ